MNKGVKTIIFPVRDVARAKAIFTQWVGAEPQWEQPYYVGYRIGDQDIGLDPSGHQQGLTGPVAYCHVSDIRQNLKALLDAGAEALSDVRDVGGGRLIASVKDPDGNLIGLLQDPS